MRQVLGFFFLHVVITEERRLTRPGIVEGGGGAHTTVALSARITAALAEDLAACQLLLGLI